MTYFNAIKYSDSGSLDGFARLRISNPYTIFDSKQLIDKAPLFWDEVTNGGGATSVYSLNDASTTMSVATSGEYVIRQTKTRFNYQPGKSMLVIMTGVMSTQTDISKRIGYYNTTTVAPYISGASGLYFENDGTTMSVNVAKTGVINKVTQANWNLDTMDGNGSSKVNIDWSKAQIFFLDFEWLGVGRVRFGLFVNGSPYYVHQFLHANSVTSVYMTSPNHSCRYAIRSNAVGAAGSLTHICATVQSEGGLDQNGMTFSVSHPNATSLTTNTAATFALIGIRLKQTALGSTIIPKNITILNSVTSADFKWSLILNPTVAGSFTYTDVANSSIQSSISTSNTNTVTGGTVLECGFVAATQDSVQIELDNAIRIGCSIAGVSDQLVLTVARNTNTNPQVSASIIYRDLV